MDKCKKKKKKPPICIRIATTDREQRIRVHISLEILCVSVLVKYRQAYNTRSTKSKVFLVSSCSCLCPIHQVLSRKWRCSWSSADRRCFNYIWLINKFSAYECASYIRRGLMVRIVWAITVWREVPGLLFTNGLIWQPRDLLIWVHHGDYALPGLLAERDKAALNDHQG